MASLYKKRDIWYISISINNNRITKSLRTKDYKVAREIKPYVESQIINELITGTKQCENLSFSELVDRFLNAKHDWAKTTYDMNRNILTSHLAGKPLPSNPTSRAIHIRHINQCWNYGLKHNLIKKANKIPGDIVGESRTRVYTKSELKLMFKHIKNDLFNSFVRFAYYTGARSGEIRALSRENLLDDSIIVCGKTGRRIIKLNGQAKVIINSQKPLWNYRKDYVSHHFKKEIRKLGIKNGRFHDLRRTFGLNLIKQGMSIYKVSKLLGHASVRTTEKHYAPLLTIEIEDFIL